MRLKTPSVSCDFRAPLANYADPLLTRAASIIETTPPHLGGTVPSMLIFFGSDVETSLRNSGRFLKQEQRKRWRTKQKLVSGSKHRGRICGFRGYITRRKILILYMRNPINYCILAEKWFAVPSMRRS